jgi:hypothetical protein
MNERIDPAIADAILRARISGLQTPRAAYEYMVGRPVSDAEWSKEGPAWSMHSARSDTDLLSASRSFRKRRC